MSDEIEKLPKTTLTDGSPVTPEHRDIDPKTGMQRGYVVLATEERAKGFVRPVRRSYTHVGNRPKFPLRDLTPEEKALYPQYDKFEPYPEDQRPDVGRFWTTAELMRGCGVTTTMGVALAETYARDPSFYGATYCAGCGTHYPVGKDGEFVWADGSGQKVGT